MTVRVRPAVPGDLDRIADLEAACFSSPWAREALEAELARTWARILVAEEGEGAGEVVAFVNYWLVADEVHVLNVATDPSRRRQGLGRALVSAVLEHARAARASTVLLEVRAANDAALGLYAALGFERVGIRPRYYDDGEDAVLMTARIAIAT